MPGSKFFFGAQARSMVGSTFGQRKANLIDFRLRPLPPPSRPESNTQLIDFNGHFIWLPS